MAISTLTDVSKQYTLHNNTGHTNIKHNVKSEPEWTEIEEESPSCLAESLHLTGLSLQSACTPPMFNLPRRPVQLLTDSLRQSTENTHFARRVLTVQKGCKCGQY